MEMLQDFKSYETFNSFRINYNISQFQKKQENSRKQHECKSNLDTKRITMSVRRQYKPC
jgi:hypothetical protein